VDGAAGHLRYDPATGATTDLTQLSYLAGDLHAGDAPAISALAYTDSYASALGTRLVGIDTTADALVEVTDEPLGLVRTIGATGVDAGAVAGFDIAGVSTAEQGFALLAAPGATRSRLYRIDLATGAAASRGEVGTARRYGGLALLGPERGGIQSSSDAWTAPDPEDEEQMLAIDRFSVCPADAPYRRLTLQAALTSAEDFLRDRAGQDALDAFAASPEYDDALQSVGVAAFAVTKGEPGAALAALLRAHELKPGDATILLNAAGVAASVGLGSEALAMIQAAETMAAPARSPMGLDWTGRVQLAYAHAYTSLSQWDNAGKAAQAGRAHETDLTSEASGVLAAVELCRDDDTSKAAEYRVRAHLRNTPQSPLDETRGQVMHLRNIPLPALPENAAGDVDFYWGFVGRLGGESVTNAQRNQQLFGKLDKPADPAVKRRRDGLLARTSKVSNSSVPSALLQQSSKSIDDAMAEHQKLFGPQGRYIEFLEKAADACSGSEDDMCFTNEMRSRCVPATRLAHSAWLDEVTEAIHAEERRIEVISRRMSGIAANFADADHVNFVLNQIEGHEISAASGIVHEAHFWTVSVRGFADHCVEPVEPSSASEPDAPHAAGNPCPPAVKALAWKAKLHAGTTAGGSPYEVGVKINCEEIEAEGSVNPLPFIHAFGSINYSAKSGETTLVIGGKAKAGGTIVEGDFQSGIYIKVDSKGDFQDVGWRIGPTIAATSSLVEYSANDTEDLSFVEGVKYMTTDL
jgi:hypothetical protein